MHTFRSPQKIRFTHENIDNNKIAEDVYTLHGEDELPLCLFPKHGYIGITTTIPFPCSNRFRTVGSCNGTFCLKTKNGLTLWNPSIRRKVRVPECPRSSELALGGKLPVDGAFQFQPQPQTTNECNLLLTTYGEGFQIYNPKTGVRSGVLGFNAASSLIDFRECVETLHLLDIGEVACKTTQL
uniref:Uncharacterized protein n=2 Tax=Lactuca sativa TaxID=4236 RepID=A0A9R1UZF9_LACSA|nr:hypothetical protein LSAT_V11C700383310 [Lactuca sativa]KAJ0196850.1 hypothetical protein LSAT_V11C700383330 [Lactuca sativa]